ncbi:MAG: hypothetical protein JNL70_25595 [Saprospiraceae bacterium]|nr:hypothetical protein [Saprospiraceae bacterium]
MKKTIIVLLCLLMQLSSKSQDVFATAKKLWTIEEVKAVAQKYNFEDSVVLPRFKYLQYMDKVNMEYYIKENAKVAQSMREMLEYVKQTKYVRTFDDHEKLVNRYPSVREAMVKMRGGEEAHDCYVESANKYGWRIYRDSGGALTFLRADEPIDAEEYQYGQRVDNLPPEKPEKRN